MTARFWVPLNADDMVRLSVRPGQVVQWERGGPTEEGWQVEGATYHIEGDELVRESWCDGRDCDGRMSHDSITACRLDRLDAHEHDGVRYPAWETRETHLRDYQAEAAGY